MPRLNPGVFLGLSELRTINLATNRINSTNFLIDLMPFVKFIDISANQLWSLNEMLGDAINARYANADCSLEIDLLDNPLSCECEDLPFIKWIRTTRVNLTKVEMVKCTGQDGQLQTINSIEMSGMDNYCSALLTCQYLRNCIHTGTGGSSSSLPLPLASQVVYIPLEIFRKETSLHPKA